MKRVRITAVVLSMMILFSMVMANKTKTVYADEVEETTETSVESEEETVSTEETSVEEAPVEEAQVEEVYLLLDVNKEFVSKIFKTNQDFYYDLNANQANQIYTREDVDKSIKMLPQLDAVSILYQTRSANDGGKSLNVRYSLPEELMTYMSNPEQMKALGIYVNGVQIPLDSYSFNNDGSEYYFYANDDAGCCFDFSSGTLDLVV
ncbi:MAG: hypothetical protein K6F79_00140 [Saccharofermentans sp.]|nr:hypothetical protein [Saccharofermentans sp.]